MILTLVRTEAPLLVVIIAVSGSAPQLAVSSPLTGAGVVLFTQEHKGEVAGRSLSISTDYSGVWKNKDITTTVRKQAIVGIPPCYSSAVVPVTHHGRDRIHISCLCQSCLWWHTSGIRHCGPLWYSCHTPH